MFGFGLKNDPLGPVFFFLYILRVVLYLFTAGILTAILGTLAGIVDLVVCRRFLIGNILITDVATAVIYSDEFRHCLFSVTSPHAYLFSARTKARGTPALSGNTRDNAGVFTPGKCRESYLTSTLIKY